MQYSHMEQIYSFTLVTVKTSGLKSSFWTKTTGFFKRIGPSHQRSDSQREVFCLPHAMSVGGSATWQLIIGYGHTRNGDNDDMHFV